MYVHVQVTKPDSSKPASAYCQWIVVIGGKGLPAISAAAVPTTTSAAVPTTTSAAGPLLLGFGFIDSDLAAVEAGTIEFLDSFLRLALARHLDKAKALALTRITIRDHVDPIDRAALAKRILQSLLGR